MNPNIQQVFEGDVSCLLVFQKRKGGVKDKAGFKISVLINALEDVCFLTPLSGQVSAAKFQNSGQIPLIIRGV